MNALRRLNPLRKATEARHSVRNTIDRATGTPRKGGPQDPPKKGAGRAYTAGLMLEKAGRYDAAERAYKRAVKLDDRFDKWVYRRALMLFRVGRAEDALDYLSSFLLTRFEARSARLYGVIAVLRKAGEDRTMAHESEAACQLRALELAEQDVRPRGDELLWWGVAYDISGAHDVAGDRYIDFLRDAGATENGPYCAHRLQKLGLSGENPDGLASPLWERAPRWFKALDRNHPATHAWSVAARTMESLTLDDADARKLYQLGVANHHLENDAAAAKAFGRAVELEPLNPSYQRRLGDVLASLGQLDDAIAAYRAAIISTPTHQDYAALASLYERTEQWQEAEGAHNMAARLHPSPDSKATRRLLRIFRQKSDWAAVAALYESICLHNPRPADWYQLGFARERIGDFQRARVVYQTAVAKEPRADWYLRLGIVEEQLGSPGSRIDATLGVVFDPHANKQRAIDAYQRALELDPVDARVRSRLGLLHLATDNPEAAIDQLEAAVQLEPEEWRGHHRLGRAYAQLASNRGAYLKEEYDLLQATWGRAIELAPYQGSPRQQLVRYNTKAGRWKAASDAAWLPNRSPKEGSAVYHLEAYLEIDDAPPDRPKLEELLVNHGDEIVEQAPTEWLFALHWRLVSDGEFTLGYQAKDLLARSMVDSYRRRKSTSLPALLGAARAHMQLDQTFEVERLLFNAYQDLDDPAAARALDKYRADLELLAGDTAPYAALLSCEGGNSAASEEAFTELIAGKTVAIVGPAMSSLENGTEIDGFDTVIRTKYRDDQDGELSAITGTRTDISYYTLSGAHFLDQKIRSALADESLKMAVFRTAAYTPEQPSLTRPGDLRYVPSEFVLNLRAAQFAIQRICHDILRYSPAQVKVFNADFFTGHQSYIPGYVQDYSQLKEGLTRTLLGFGHDYLADFRFTKSVHRNGLIDVDPAIAEILQLSGDEYLAKLDETRRI